jgi:hypothetical protein
MRRSLKPEESRENRRKKRKSLWAIAALDVVQKDA